MSFIDTGKSSVQSNNSCSDHGFTQIIGRPGVPQRQSSTSSRSPCVSPTTIFQSNPQNNAGNQGEKLVLFPKCPNSISFLNPSNSLHSYPAHFQHMSLDREHKHAIAAHFNPSGRALLSYSLNCLMYYS